MASGDYGYLYYGRGKFGLSSYPELAGAVVATSAVTGEAQKIVTLAAAVNASVSISAEAGRIRTTAAEVTATSSVSAAATRLRNIAGEVDASVSITADLTRIEPSVVLLYSYACKSTSSISGDAIRGVGLFGDVVSASQVSAKWMPYQRNAVSWSEQDTGSETWTKQTVSEEIWQEAA